MWAFMRVALPVTVATVLGLLAACAGLTPAGDAANLVTADSNQVTTTSVGNTNAPVTDSNTPVINPNTQATVFNCDNANFPVCDGFELVAAGGPPDGNRWNSNVQLPPPGDDGVRSDNPCDTVLEVSTAFAHRGKNSLHIHTTTGWEHKVIQDVTSAAFPKPFLPAPNNIFFVRYWVYDNGFAGDLTQTPQGGAHMYMVNASGPLAGKQQYEKLGGGLNNMSWNYWGQDQGFGDGTNWPMGVWSCIEVEFKGDSSELVVWMNDTELPGLRLATNTWAAPAYNRLTLGWEIDHPPASFKGTDVYIDDIAYAYKRIGCAP